ncbi:MAG: phage holin family protein [Pseudomonadota bacterium]
MLESEQESETGGQATSAHPEPSGQASAASATDKAASAPFQDETIIEELGALIDDAQLYAKAEIAFQKTRASLVGRNVGAALGAVILAIILLHIALIALAVGLVLALQPFVTIWGAIGIVVGVMLLGVGALGWIAVQRGRRIAAMFAADPQVQSDGTPASGDPQ